MPESPGRPHSFQGRALSVVLTGRWRLLLASKNQSVCRDPGVRFGVSRWNPLPVSGNSPDDTEKDVVAEQLGCKQELFRILI